MIDIHSHLVNNVDDGSKNIEESILMINEAYEAGFTDIILTPHYMENFYTKESIEIAEKVNKIKEKISNINLNIYQGNEIYISSELINFVKEKKAITLADSKYILFELPMQQIPFNLDEVIYLILSNGYVPIIAHPERYLYVQENPNILIDYIERGVLFQANYGSVVGIYGGSVKATVKKLLTNNMIHFLGSDNHSSNTIYKNIPKIITILNKLIGEEKVKELTNTNPMKILKNENFDIEAPIPIKKSICKFWK